MTDTLTIIQILLLIIQIVVLLDMQTSLSSINTALDDLFRDDDIPAAVRLDPSRDDIF